MPQLKKDEKPKTSRLAIAGPFWVVEFDPSMEGIDPITQDGTEVPYEKVNPIRQAAYDTFGVYLTTR